MSGIGTGYDLSTTTYSPDGKVFQVDYACKAVDNGGLALGVRCKDGVVLGVEKLLVSVEDHDILGEQDFMGSCAVPLDEINNHNTVQEASAAAMPTTSPLASFSWVPSSSCHDLL